MPTLYYFHDPMCSWCWGYRPTAEKLFASLPAAVTRKNIVGGLAPDSDELMPRAQRVAIAGHWKRIENMLGTHFNHDFWKNGEPRRSTYPACRAVLAAALQNREESMTLAIQEAYYLNARNPSDVDTLQELAVALGLDAERFNADLRSATIEAELQRQVGFARQSPISGFPSLVLEYASVMTPVTVDYQDYATSLREIEKLLG